MATKVTPRRTPKRAAAETRDLMPSAAADVIRDRAEQAGDEVVASALSHIRLTHVAERVPRFHDASAHAVPLEEMLRRTMEEVLRHYSEDPLFRVQLSFLISTGDERVRSALAHLQSSFTVAADQGVAGAPRRLRAAYPRAVPGAPPVQRRRRPDRPVGGHLAVRPGHQGRPRPVRRAGPSPPGPSWPSSASSPSPPRQPPAADCHPGPGNPGQPKLSTWKRSAGTPSPRSSDRTAATIGGGPAT